ncbi:MAG: hypothetical protein JWN88_130 [Frankiales bacterium]|jgi:hypothetical protein|nr:hypothetical protein [Frankiales bacterium]
MTTPSAPGAADGPVEPTAPHGQPPAQVQPPYRGQGTPAGSPPPVTFEGQTFPGTPDQQDVKKSGVRKGLLLGGVAALTLAVAGGAVYAGTQLSGGGKQPEDVLPRDAMAFAKVDFDPAAGQKIALYRLAQKFPDAKVNSEEGVKDDLLSQLFEGDEDIDYAKDIQPWIGDRVGVAVLPDGDDEDDEPDVMAAVAFSDEDAARKALPDLAEPEDPDEDPLFYAFSEAGDYVLLGQSQGAVDAAAKGEEFLADAKSYSSAVDELEGDQIVTVWGDAGAIWAAVPAEGKAEATGTYGKDVDPKGQFIAGLHADADFIEMTGRGVDLTTGIDVAQLGSGKGTGLLTEFPEDLLVGMSVTGLGEALAAGFDQISRALGDEADLQAIEDEFGITLPEDITTLLGDETALGVYGTKDDPQVVGRTRGGDPDAALAVAEKLRKAAQGPSTPSRAPELQGAVKKHDGGIAFGLTQEGVDRVAAAGGLGADPAFAKALPDAEGATFLLYADIDRILSLFEQDLTLLDEDGRSLRNAQVLQAVGLSATGSENGSFRLRLTVA